MLSQQIKILAVRVVSAIKLDSVLSNLIALTTRTAICEPIQASLEEYFLIRVNER